MFRTALLRNVMAAAARPAARPIVSSSLARLAACRVAPSASSWVPTAAAPWSAVRCYSADGGLDKESVEGRIMDLLAGFDKVNDPANIKPNAHFANDLGLDSLDTVEVVMAIEEEFSIEIPDKDADTIHSVDKAVEYIVNQPDAN